MDALGLYLHFPFCVQKCRYCDFPSCAGKESLMFPYLEALLREIDLYARDQRYRIGTIYMGGGTPTLFDGQQLVRVLKHCIDSFDVDENAEITVECNPGTVDGQKLKILAEGGFNRLSIGLQAWQDRLLEYLGRIHRRKHFAETVEWAASAGFQNISADVIYGIPGQTVDEFIETLNEAAACCINHLSAYSLKIEEGTVFHSWLESGKLKEADEDTEREMYHRGISLLSHLGFRQYEISNFARPSSESRHNLNYWKNGHYIGCGTGAHSYLNRTRKWNIKDIALYIYKMEHGQSVMDSSQEIDTEDELFEAVMLGMRLNEGISKQDFQRRYGVSLNELYHEQISALKKKGLVTEDEFAIKPTPLGMDFQNMIALAFM